MRTALPDWCVKAVIGHAARTYAWSSPIEGSDKRGFFAVLHMGPIKSPVDAVRAAILAENRTPGAMRCRPEPLDPCAAQRATMSSGYRLVPRAALADRNVRAGSMLTARPRYSVRRGWQGLSRPSNKPSSEPVRR
jgi:hypothetical protein